MKKYKLGVGKTPSKDKKGGNIYSTAEKVISPSKRPQYSAFSPDKGA